MEYVMHQDPQPESSSPPDGPDQSHQTQAFVQICRGVMNHSSRERLQKFEDAVDSFEVLQLFAETCKSQLI